MDWFKQFLELYMKGHRKEAYLLKHCNIPNKLYKYMRIDDKRINALLNGQIWFSIPRELNDPYDCYGVYWNEHDLSNLFKDVLPPQVFEKQTVNDIAMGAIKSLREHIRVTCFSEELYSMPLWAHYADNHRGICVEYDFSQLGPDESFIQYLYPVGYDIERYDITDLLKRSFSMNIDSRIYLLFFLMLLKHKSWEYEKEWRILLPTDESRSCLIDCPIQPSAVYFGLNCKDYKEIKNRLIEKIRCPMYRLVITNSKYFKLDAVQI